MSGGFGNVRVACKALAAEDIAAAYDDGDLDAQLVNAMHFRGHVSQGLAADAKALGAGQTFPADLEHDAAKLPVVLGELIALILRKGRFRGLRLSVRRRRPAIARSWRSGPPRP